MFKQITVFFIFITSVYFFKLVFIPFQMGLAIGFGTCILMLITILLTNLYDKGPGFPQLSGLIIGLVLITAFIGAFGARWGHNQGYLLSLWASGYMYFYLLYFLLHSIRIRPDELERLLVLMGIFFLFAYFFQYIIYPTIIFGVRAGVERGTVRIFLPGGSFAAFMFYFFLQKTFTSDKKFYVILCLLYLAVPILQGTRSAIANLLLGTLIFILFNKQVKSKMVVMTLMLIASVLVFFIFQDIIMNLIHVSESQAAQEDDDIRVRSAKFFLYEFSPTKLNYWIGNGESHMAHAYGMRVYYYKAFYGFYQSDVGIIGEYSKYGILWIICVFLIARKLFISRIAPQYIYMKFYTLNLMFDLFLGGAFSRSYDIVVITSILYIYDVSNFELRNKDKNGEEKLTGQPILS
jgi:hypothetical protein